MPRDESPPIELPRALRDFLLLYRAGRFWDSHEALEGAWRETGSDFYQGLILYASAWVHWERGNAHGVRAQLEKARRRLADYAPFYLGIDVDAVRAHCLECVEEVQRAPDDWPQRIAPHSLGVHARRVRGGEPEVGG